MFTRNFRGVGDGGLPEYKIVAPLLLLPPPFYIPDGPPGQPLIWPPPTSSFYRKIEASSCRRSLSPLPSQDDSQLKTNIMYSSYYESQVSHAADPSARGVGIAML